MTDAVEAQGKTVEEAIDAGLERLGATEDEVEIRILAEGGPRGIFGRKVDPARVRIWFRDERTPEEIALEEEEGPADHEDESRDPVAGRASDIPVEELGLDEQADAAEEFLEGLLEQLGIDAEVGAEVGSRNVSVEITGSDMGLLIGKQGATLEALQDLTRAAVQRKTERRPRVNLDVEGYRARIRAGLERKARGAASRAMRSGRPFKLEPMSSFQRKIVHNLLSRMDGVSTSSEGEEPARRVVIHPAGRSGSRGGGRSGNRAGSRPPRG